MKNLPVYKHPAAYAREHDELAVPRFQSSEHGLQGSD